jgi:hypothetical protein
MSLLFVATVLIPFFAKTSSNDAIWIALIGAISGIGTMLGLNKLVPTIIKWIEEKRDDRRKRKLATRDEYLKLTKRIDDLELKLDRAERFETQTRSTINGMIPLMKEMMKEHPVYVDLLKKLEENIIGEDINEVTQSI